jgi:mono/diheme cytochrome c family protein
VVRVVTVALLPMAFGACTWFTDFKNQPRIEPWEPMSQNDNDTTTPPRGQPMYSVPMSGLTAAAYGISYSPNLPVIDSFAPIPSPVAADARSLENGKKHYQINCAVCHGAAGDGNGGLKKVNAAYGYAPSLLTETGKARTVGYLYGIMRNGRGSMPNYNRIEEMDRWDVANYVKALHAGTADTLPIGYPGQNGATVPGPSRSAPTVPAPFVKPQVTLTKGSSGQNAATFKGGNDVGATKSQEKHE